MSAKSWMSENDISAVRLTAQQLLLGIMIYFD